MPHICLKCNGNFHTKQHLDRHLDRIRPCDQKSNTCSHCNITFANKKNYTYHKDHNVCIRKPEQIINNETVALDISCNQDIDLEREKIILEREKIALRRMELLVELKKMVTSNKVISRQQGYIGCSEFRRYSKGQIQRLSYMSVESPNIRHALNGGEYRIKESRYYADGYSETTNTIYEYHGDYFHGNPKIYDENDVNSLCSKTFGELFERTNGKKRHILVQGYKYVYIWESDWHRAIRAVKTIQKQFRKRKSVTKL